MDPADTLRDTNALLGLLVYVPEPTTDEDIATFLSLKVGGHIEVSNCFARRWAQTQTRKIRLLHPLTTPVTSRFGNST